MPGSHSLKGCGEGSGEKEGQSRQARRLGLRAEVKLSYLQEGLGPDSEMQLQTSALLTVEWPKLTAQPETLHLWAFLGRKRKLEPEILSFENSNRYSTLGPQLHSQDDLPGSEALRREGSDLQLPVFAVCGSGNPWNPTGRGKRLLAASSTSLQNLRQPVPGFQDSFNLFFYSFN